MTPGAPPTAAYGRTAGGVRANLRQVRSLAGEPGGERGDGDRDTVGQERHALGAAESRSATFVYRERRLVQ